MTRAAFLRTLVAQTEPEADDSWDSAIGDVIIDLAALAYHRFAAQRR